MMSDTNKDAAEVPSDVEPLDVKTPADKPVAQPGEKQPETEHAPRLDD